eukprot:3600316-Rhodomonas_salina.2
MMIKKTCPRKPNSIGTDGSSTAPDTPNQAARPYTGLTSTNSGSTSSRTTSTLKTGLDHRG